jgi:hypothetical protein
VSWKLAALRNESVQAGLGNTKQQLVVLTGCLPSLASCFVGINDSQLADNVTSYEFAVASIFNLDTAEHLAHDDFKVLVSNVLTLAGKDTRISFMM